MPQTMLSTKEEPQYSFEKGTDGLEGEKSRVPAGKHIPRFSSP
jgi:hypothetical protein